MKFKSERKIRESASLSKFKTNMAILQKKIVKFTKENLASQKLGGNFT